MGVDCILKVGNEYYALDRWYVFLSAMEHRKEMSRREALGKIRKLGRPRELKKVLFGLYKNERGEVIRYHKYWLSKAKKIIESAKSDPITFYIYDDCPEEYYSKRSK